MLVFEGVIQVCPLQISSYSGGYCWLSYSGLRNHWRGTCANGYGSLPGASVLRAYQSLLAGEWLTTPEKTRWIHQNDGPWKKWLLLNMAIFGIYMSNSWGVTGEKMNWLGESFALIFCGQLASDWSERLYSSVLVLYNSKTLSSKQEGWYFGGSDDFLLDEMDVGKIEFVLPFVEVLKCCWGMQTT